MVLQVLFSLLLNFLTIAQPILQASMDVRRNGSYRGESGAVAIIMKRSTHRKYLFSPSFYLHHHHYHPEP